MTFAAAVLAACFVPRPAVACTARCDVPGAELPSQATIPANAPALLFRPVWRDATPCDRRPLDASLVRLFRVPTLAPDPIPVDLSPESDFAVVRLLRPLEPSTTYRYEVDSTSPASPPWGTRARVTYFETGPAAPFPEQLGTLRDERPESTWLVVRSLAGGCSVEVPAVSVRVHVDFSPDAAPWEHVLVYETTVDGNPWRASRGVGVPTTLGGSWVGRGSDRLYAVCGATLEPPTDQLEQGTHRVVVRAHVAGRANWIESTAVDVTLSCPTSIPMQGTSPTRDVPEVRGDAATAYADAWLLRDAGGATAAVGCACTARSRAGRTRDLGGATVLVALLAASMRLRRPRVSAGTSARAMRRSSLIGGFAT